MAKLTQTACPGHRLTKFVPRAFTRSPCLTGFLPNFQPLSAGFLPRASSGSQYLTGCLPRASAKSPCLTRFLPSLRPWSNQIFAQGFHTLQLAFSPAFTGARSLVPSWGIPSGRSCGVLRMANTPPCIGSPMEFPLAVAKVLVLSRKRT